MAVTETEVLAGLHLGDLANTGAGDLFLSQLENADPAWNPEILSVIPAGHTHPLFVGIQSRKEEIPFTTGQVAGVIARLGNYGVNVSPSKLYYRTMQNLSGLAAVDGEVHSIFTATKAMAYPVSLTAGHRKQAQIRGQLLPVFDGTNEPLVRVGDGDIVDDPTAAEVFELGPIVVPTATILEGCDNLDIQWNPQVTELADGSVKKTTFAGLMSIAPVITFTSTDRYVGDLEGPIEGVKIHLVRMKHMDESYASNLAQHILITVPKGVLVKSGKQDAPSAYRMELHCSGDATDGWGGNPITWTVNTAFSLT